jgi:hypothetical protein
VVYFGCYCFGFLTFLLIASVFAVVGVLPCVCGTPVMGCCTTVDTNTLADGDGAGSR